MSTIAARRTVEFPSRTIIVRELTVAEVRAWIIDLETGIQPDHFLSMLDASFNLSDLPRMTDASAAQIEALRPSELDHLVRVAKALNPDFFTNSGYGGDRCRSSDIDQSCCALVSHGHAGVFEYPWRTYLTACRVAGGK